jgi:saccharopine dehydrogenase (NAD+, L-lysine-forming)
MWLSFVLPLITAAYLLRLPASFLEKFYFNYNCTEVSYMSKALIIGAGGVANVVIHKCCQNYKVFSEILIASRTLSKCDAIKASLGNTITKVSTAKVDADNTKELVALLIKNVYSTGYCHQCGVAVSGSDHHGCLSCRSGDRLSCNNRRHIMIPATQAKFVYSWQWAYRKTL